MPNNPNPAGCCSNNACCTGDLKITVLGCAALTTSWTCATFTFGGVNTWHKGGGGPMADMTCDNGVYTVTFSLSGPACGDGQGPWNGNSFKQTVLDCDNFKLEGNVGTVRGTCSLCGGSTLTVRVEKTCS